MDAKRAINGTFGTVWIDQVLVGETYGLQAKVAIDKEDVNLCGQLATDSKIKSTKGTGTLKTFKVNSRFIALMNDAIKNGRDVRCTIISKLADPDSNGVERIAINNVSFDELTLADFEAATIQKNDVPFTFTGYDVLDSIPA